MNQSNKIYDPRKVIRDWRLSWELGSAVECIINSCESEQSINELLKAKKYIDYEIEALKEEQILNAFNHKSENEIEL